MACISSDMCSSNEQSVSSCCNGFSLVCLVSLPSSMFEITLLYALVPKILNFLPVRLGSWRQPVFLQISFKYYVPISFPRMKLVASRCSNFKREYFPFPGLVLHWFNLPPGILLMMPSDRNRALQTSSWTDHTLLYRLPLGFYSSATLSLEVEPERTLCHCREDL